MVQLNPFKRDRWKKGQTNLQKGALWVQKKVYKGESATDKSGIGKKAILNLADSTKDKRKTVEKGERRKRIRTKMHSRTKVGKAQAKRARQKAMVAARKQKRAEAKNKK